MYSHRCNARHRFDICSTIWVSNFLYPPSTSCQKLPGSWRSSWSSNRPNVSHTLRSVWQGFLADSSICKMTPISNKFKFKVLLLRCWGSVLLRPIRGESFSEWGCSVFVAQARLPLLAYVKISDIEVEAVSQRGILIPVSSVSRHVDSSLHHRCHRPAVLGQRKQG